MRGLIAGALSAILAVAGVSESFGGGLLALLAPTPLLWTGLTGSSAMAGLSAVIATLGIGLLTGWTGAAGFVGLVAIPALLLVELAVPRKLDAGRLVLWLTGYAAFAIVVAEVGATLAGSSLPELADQAFRPALEALLAGAEPQLLESERQMGASGLLLLLPALAAGFWLAATTASAALALGLAERFGELRRKPIRMAGLKLPKRSGPWLGVALGLTGLVGAVPQGAAAVAALNLAMVLVTPFVFVGLGVLHAGARGHIAARLVLAAGYLAAPVLLWLAVPLVALLGMIDGVADLRKRFGWWERT